MNVILVVHILACIAMTGVILLQRSEGGALGIGGGGGGLMSSRGVAGALVRTTMLFGGVFFLTSLVLTTMANRGADRRSDVEITIEGEIPNTETTPDDPFGLDLNALPDIAPQGEQSNSDLPPLPDAELVAPVETNSVPENR